MSRFIRVGKELVPVSKKIYKEYYRMRRRERYMEKDIKFGRIDLGPNPEDYTFVPSKEDSIERIMEKGDDFASAQRVEDIICDKATLLILQEAMAELNRDEQELIYDLYHKNLTVREVAKQQSISHVTVVKRHKKVLDKLRKFFI